MTENLGLASSNLDIGTIHASRIPKRVVWGLLALGLLLLFFVLPHDIEGDGRLRFEAIQSLLAGGGIPDTKYPLIGSILSIPLFLLGRFVGSPEWWASRYNIVVYAAGPGILQCMLRHRLERAILLAVHVVLHPSAIIPPPLTRLPAY